MIIFGLYIYLQIQHQGRQHYYQVSIFLLFLLSTATIAIAISDFIAFSIFIMLPTGIFNNFSGDLPLNFAQQESYLNHLDINFQIALAGIYAGANIIADTLLLYRCFTLWAPRLWVKVGLGILSAINAGMAILSVTLQNMFINDYKSISISATITFGVARILFSYVFLGVNLLTNLVLTGLIAGRLWWISRRTQKYLGLDSSNSNRMNKYVAMVLESGLLYPLALTASIAAVKTERYDFGMPNAPILTLFVGIAATMIMVRADLGISIEAMASSTNSNNDCRNLSDTEVHPVSHLHPSQVSGTSQPLPLFQLQERPKHQESLTPFTYFRSNPVPQKYTGNWDIPPPHERGSNPCRRHGIENKI
ncbi:hypothetical protein GYMLUDRAFT_773080 [Collybiopsis luxurians FD-317 M1]|uniref:Uncharacterized protein n=1 Tax=Collybiopsis luxurians FD-317 M1 TaxID=944289 RepID=A0A0D0BPU0_9AGAR|nr:hypothetical protein GYMLUDRAFT_773080 [Collybiopsis luxurians FD-317 M1]